MNTYVSLFHILYKKKQLGQRIIFPIIFKKKTKIPMANVSLLEEGL